MFSFKDYKILKKLGSGATSDVYLALTPKGEQRALKVFNQMLPIEQGDITFQRELDNLNTLRSERVVRVYGLEKSESGQWVLIQEYIEGKNLSELQTADYTMLERVVICLVIASEILYALEESHSKGIIHRDIKPENIILHKDGRVVLTDFGLSKNTNINQVTIHGQIFGSPQYMSIDQFTKKDASPLFDIYSMAVLMYEMLTGVTPYQGENIEVILNAKRNGHFKSLEKLNPYTPEKLSTIINQILKNEYGTELNQAYKLRFKLLNIIDNLNFNSNKVLSNLCANKRVIDKDKSSSFQSIILTQLEDKYDSLKKGAQKNTLLGQILKIDNSNKRGASGSRLRPLLACSFGAISAAFGFWYLMPSFNESSEQRIKLISEPIKTQVTPEKPIVLKPAEKKLKIEAPVVKKEVVVKKKKPVPARVSKVKKVFKKKMKPTPVVVAPKVVEQKKVVVEKTGYLIVNVPSDIRVFVGEQRIIRLGDKLKFPVGKYEISLKKIGYPTMKSTIEITAGKNTLINLD